MIHGLGAFYLLTPAMLLATIGAAIMTWRTKRGRPSLVAGIGATSVVAFTFAHFIPGCWCSSVPAARVTPVDTRQAGSLRWLSNGCCGIGRGWRFDKKVRYLCGLFGHRVREVTRRDGLVEYNVARVAPSGCQAGRPARSGALSRRQCLWASTAVGLRGDRTRNR